MARIPFSHPRLRIMFLPYFLFCFALGIKTFQVLGRSLNDCYLSLDSYLLSMIS